MNLFFIISDYLNQTYPIGLLKEKLWHADNSLKIIELTHQIKLNNIAEAAFVAKNIQTSDNQPYNLIVKVGYSKKLIIYEQFNNYYLLPDNGILTLLFENPDLNKVYAVDRENEALALQSMVKKDMSALEQFRGFKWLTEKKPHQVDQFLMSEAIHINQHGNCYFNIKKTDFEAFVADRPYQIRVQYFNTAICKKVSEHLSQIEAGTPGVVFNKAGYLKLVFNMGNAQKLLRIKEDTKIIIEKL